MKYIGQHIFDYVASFRQKVGIGTDTPDSLLEITSSSATDFLKLTSTSGSANPIKLIFEKSSTEQGIIEYNRNGDFEIYNNDSDGGVMIDGSASAGADFYVANSGNVGIGTASPDKLLVVKGADAEIVVDDTNSTPLIRLRENGTTKSEITTSSGALTFSSGGATERMRIDSSGNVGIGLTSPSQKLEVSGNALASNLISSGYVKLGADNQILSDGSITIDIDYNNNQTDRFFKVRKDNSTDLFTISEDASASFVGDVTITKSDPTLILEDTSGTDNQARIWLRESASYGVQLEYQSDVSDFFQISMIDANVGNTNPIPALTINRNTNATFANDVTVTGNLTVSGTTTTIDTTNLNVEDKNITINYSTGDSSSTADGAGITIQDAVDSSTNATLLWNATQDRFNFSHAVQLPDSTLLYLGSDSDMNVQHTGSDGFIMNDTGHLYIRNRADDKDIIFQTDDGSGSVTEYFRVDGSSEKTFYSKPILLFDSVALQLGTGTDATLYHSGGEGNLQNFTGNFRIIQGADDSDIQFFCDDGSGGVTEYFRLDGGTERIRVSKNLRLSDSVELQLGNVSDLTLAHDGTNSEIANNTGDLTIKNRADDKDIIFQSDDGSGGVTTYMTIDGSAGAVNFGKHIKFEGGYLIDSAHSLRLDSTSGQAVLISQADTTVASFTTSAIDLTTTKLTLTGALDIGADDSGHDVIFYGATSGKYMQWDESNNYLNFRDSTKIMLGNSNDLQLSHNGTDSYIENVVGNLYIKNTADDKDIIFQSDDGSGGVTTYFQLDGSHTETVFSENIRFADDKNANFGDSSDLKIYHSSSNSFIQNDTGNLIIRNNVDDGDIRLQSDDGSGGIATYITLAGNSSRTLFSKEARFSDNVNLKFGDGGDLQIYHDGTTSKITNDVGDIHIQNNTDDGDIIFRSDDGSGGTTAYITLDGSLTRTIANQHLQMADGKALYVGASSDAGFYHLSGHNYIENNTGNLIIVQNTDDADILFKADDGSGGTTTYMTIDGGAAITTVSREMRFFDNVKLKLGSGPDAEFYHDGSNTYLLNNTGNLDIRCQTDNGDIIFRCDDGSGGNAEYLRLDGGFSSPQIKIPDNVQMNFGAGLDLRIIHDGFDSYISSNGTGHLYIRQLNDDKDIIFQCDDGSGGTMTYFFLDGSAKLSSFKNADVIFYGASSYMQWDQSQDSLELLDNVKIKFGTNDDLQIHHDGSNSYIKQFDSKTGNLIIEQATDDADIIFKCDDGSGGTTAYLYLDGSNTITRAEKEIRFADNVKATFGNAADLDIYHDGTDSIIDNAVGNLTISNNADDGDILFQSDNGSGGVTNYLKIDGGNTNIQVSKNLYSFDNVKIAVGDSLDLQIYHNGTDSVIDNVSSGDLYISQKVADKDLIFRADDGSGGFTEYFRLDGSGVFMVGSKSLYMLDDNRLYLGSAGDMELNHNGTNSFIYNHTGDLTIQNNTDDGDIVFKSDNGSGGTTTYFKIAGGAEQTVFNKKLKLEDSVELRFGTGNDMKIYHDGTNNYIQGVNGDLYIQNGSDDKDIILRSDDGSGGQTAYLTLDGSQGFTTAQKTIRFDDSVGLQLGGSGDLQVFHNGTDSHIANYTGDLKIINYNDDKDIIFQSDDGSGGVTTYFKLDGSSATHDGSTTTSMYTQWEDNSIISLGTGKDFNMYHTGTKTIFTNATGHLDIRNTATNSDIIFQADDGSGSFTEYFRVDGGSEKIVVSKPFNIVDGIGLKLGTGGNDFSAYHNGTDTFLDNNTGHLNIRNTADDKDIKFVCDDQSGGVATYFYLDGSVGFNRFPYPVIVEDSVNFNLGTGQDMQLLHNGSDSVIRNATGDLYIQQNVDDGDIIFQSDDGSGGTTEYFRLDGSAVTVEVSKPINLASASSSASSGIYAQFINLKGFCTLAANYLFAEDLEDTKSPFEMAVDYGSATISSSTEINQSNLFRASGFHVPVACSVNAINMQLTCNNAGNVTIAVVEYRPSEAGTDQVDHPKTIYEEVVVASNNNNNKVKTVTVATADLDNTAIPAGSHIMIMAKGDDQTIGGKAFISAAIEIKW